MQNKVLSLLFFAASFHAADGPGEEVASTSSRISFNNFLNLLNIVTKRR